MMYALVFVACLSASSSVCRAEASAERFPLQIGCSVAAVQQAASFEASNPGWRVREALCVPEKRLGEILAKLNGMDS